jgi:hypothetical protein
LGQQGDLTDYLHIRPSDEWQMVVHFSAQKACSKSSCSDNLSFFNLSGFFADENPQRGLEAFAS